MKSDTPITDAEMQKDWYFDENGGLVSVDFARRLERELAEAKACLKEALWWTDDEDNTPEEDARMFARWRKVATDTPNAAAETPAAKEKADA